MSAKLRQESRTLDRQIYGKFSTTLSENLIIIVVFHVFCTAIEREERKTIDMIKQAAKKNQMDVCKIAAKSLVQYDCFSLILSYFEVVISIINFKGLRNKSLEFMLRKRKLTLL
jgi:hypothetical protein